MDIAVFSLGGGGGGGGGGSSFAINFSDEEIPAGSINSANTVFALANSPNPAASLLLTLNGLVLESGNDYGLSGNTITMAVAPTTGDVLIAWYRFSGNSINFSDDETPSGVIDGVNAAFGLANAPNPANSLVLVKNGAILQQGIGKDYTLSGSTITMAVAPAGGDVLLAWYRH